jgi:hypothetical protein
MDEPPPTAREEDRPSKKAKKVMKRKIQAPANRQL